MAGEWIKFDSSLPEKPETLAVTVQMGWDDPDLTVGKLMRLFRWFDQHTTDGNARGVTPALLDRVLGVTGFTVCVASVGWISVTDDGVALANFDRHNGATAKSRAQGAKRAANHRNNAVSNAESNAPGVTEALPREEKRREEVIPEEAKASLSTSSPDGGGGQQSLDGVPAADPSAKPKAVVPPCPYGELLDAYGELCPTLPQVRRSLFDTGKRAPAMRSRWSWVMTANAEVGQNAGNRMATTTAEGIAWFRQFFEYVAQSPFLLGQVGDRNWQADIGWLMKRENFEKVLEGKYHSDMQEAAHA
nr:hypothetical protein [Comamonas thiooxydans]